VQWCDLAAVLREARRLLRPAGHLALASLGPDTFHELRRAFAGVDEYRHTLAFHTADEIGQMAVAAGLSAVSVQRTTQMAHYADFKSLLRAVKAVGANQVGDGRRTGLMSRASFLRERRHTSARTATACRPTT
jgi:malonyl-CoA O-methyltransferase